MELQEFKKIFLDQLEKDAPHRKASAKDTTEDLARNELVTKITHANTIVAVIAIVSGAFKKCIDLKTNTWLWGEKSSALENTLMAALEAVTAREKTNSIKTLLTNIKSQTNNAIAEIFFNEWLESKGYLLKDEEGSLVSGMIFSLLYAPSNDGFLEAFKSLIEELTASGDKEAAFTALNRCLQSSSLDENCKGEIQAALSKRLTTTAEKSEVVRAVIIDPLVKVDEIPKGNSTDKATAISVELASTNSSQKSTQIEAGSPERPLSTDRKQPSPLATLNSLTAGWFGSGEKSVPPSFPSVVSQIEINEELIAAHRAVCPDPFYSILKEIKGDIYYKRVEAQAGIKKLKQTQAVSRKRKYAPMAMQTLAKEIASNYYQEAVALYKPEKADPPKGVLEVTVNGVKIKLSQRERRILVDHRGSLPEEYTGIKRQNSTSGYSNQYALSSQIDPPANSKKKSGNDLKKEQLFKGEAEIKSSISVSCAEIKTRGARVINPSLLSACAISDFPGILNRCWDFLKNGTLDEAFKMSLLGEMQENIKRYFASDYIDTFQEDYSAVCAELQKSVVSSYIPKVIKGERLLYIIDTKELLDAMIPAPTSAIYIVRKGPQLYEFDDGGKGEIRSQGAECADAIKKCLKIDLDQEDGDQWPVSTAVKIPEVKIYQTNFNEFLIRIGCHTCEDIVLFDDQNSGVFNNAEPRDGLYELIEVSHKNFYDSQPKKGECYVIFDKGRAGLTYKMFGMSKEGEWVDSQYFGKSLFLVSEIDDIKSSILEDAMVKKIISYDDIRHGFGNFEIRNISAKNRGEDFIFNNSFAIHIYTVLMYGNLSDIENLNKALGVRLNDIALDVDGSLGGALLPRNMCSQSNKKINEYLIKNRDLVTKISEVFKRLSTILISLNFLLEKMSNNSFSFNKGVIRDFKALFDIINEIKDDLNGYDDFPLKSFNADLAVIKEKIYDALISAIEKESVARKQVFDSLNSGEDRLKFTNTCFEELFCKELNCFVEEIFGKNDAAEIHAKNKEFLLIKFNDHIDRLFSVGNNGCVEPLLDADIKCFFDAIDRCKFPVNNAAALKKKFIDGYLARLISHGEGDSLSDNIKGGTIEHLVHCYFSPYVLTLLKGQDLQAYNLNLLIILEKILTRITDQSQDIEVISGELHKLVAALNEMNLDKQLTQKISSSLVKAFEILAGNIVVALEAGDKSYLRNYEQDPSGKVIGFSLTLNKMFDESISTFIEEYGNAEAQSSFQALNRRIALKYAEESFEHGALVDNNSIKIIEKYLTPRAYQGLMAQKICDIIDNYGASPDSVRDKLARIGRRFAVSLSIGENNQDTLRDNVFTPLAHLINGQVSYNINGNEKKISPSLIFNILKNTKYFTLESLAVIRESLSIRNFLIAKISLISSLLHDNEKQNGLASNVNNLLIELQNFEDELGELPAAAARHEAAKIALCDQLLSDISSKIDTRNVASAQDIKTLLTSGLNGFIQQNGSDQQNLDYQGLIATVDAVINLRSPLIAANARNLSAHGLHVERSHNAVVMSAADNQTQKNKLSQALIEFREELISYKKLLIDEIKKSPLPNLTRKKRQRDVERLLSDMECCESALGAKDVSLESFADVQWVQRTFETFFCRVDAIKADVQSEWAVNKSNRLLTKLNSIDALRVNAVHFCLSEAEKYQDEYSASVEDKNSYKKSLINYSFGILVPVGVSVEKTSALKPFTVTTPAVAAELAQTADREASEVVTIAKNLLESYVTPDDVVDANVIVTAAQRKLALNTSLLDLKKSIQSYQEEYSRNAWTRMRVADKRKQDAQLLINSVTEILSELNSNDKLTLKKLDSLVEKLAKLHQEIKSLSEGIIKDKPTSNSRFLKELKPYVENENELHKSMAFWGLQEATQFAGEISHTLNDHYYASARKYSCNLAKDIGSEKSTDQDMGDGVTIDQKTVKLRFSLFRARLESIRIKDYLPESVEAANDGVDCVENMYNVFFEKEGFSSLTLNEFASKIKVYLFGELTDPLVTAFSKTINFKIIVDVINRIIAANANTSVDLTAINELKNKFGIEWQAANFECSQFAPLDSFDVNLTYDDYVTSLKKACDSPTSNVFLDNLANDFNGRFLAISAIHDSIDSRYSIELENRVSKEYLKPLGIKCVEVYLAKNPRPEFNELPASLTLEMHLTAFNNLPANIRKDYAENDSYLCALYAAKSGEIQANPDSLLVLKSYVNKSISDKLAKPAALFSYSMMKMYCDFSHAEELDFNELVAITNRLDRERKSESVAVLVAKMLELLKNTKINDLKELTSLLARFSITLKNLDPLPGISVSDHDRNILLSYCDQELNKFWKNEPVTDPAIFAFLINHLGSNEQKQRYQWMLEAKEFFINPGEVLSDQEKETLNLAFTGLYAYSSGIELQLLDAKPATGVEFNKIYISSVTARDKAEVHIVDSDGEEIIFSITGLPSKVGQQKTQFILSALVDNDLAKLKFYFKDILLLTSNARLIGAPKERAEYLMQAPEMQGSACRGKVFSIMDRPVNNVLADFIEKDFYARDYTAEDFNLIITNYQEADLYWQKEVATIFSEFTNIINGIISGKKYISNKGLSFNINNISLFCDLITNISAAFPADGVLQRRADSLFSVLSELLKDHKSSWKKLSSLLQGSSDISIEILDNLAILFALEKAHAMMQAKGFGLTAPRVSSSEVHQIVVDEKPKSTIPAKDSFVSRNTDTADDSDDEVEGNGSERLTSSTPSNSNNVSTISINTAATEATDHSSDGASMSVKEASRSSTTEETVKTIKLMTTSELVIANDFLLSYLHTGVYGRDDLNWGEMAEKFLPISSQLKKYFELFPNRCLTLADWNDQNTTLNVPVLVFDEESNEFYYGENEKLTFQVTIKNSIDANLLRDLCEKSLLVDSDKANLFNLFRSAKVSTTMDFQFSKQQSLQDRYAFEDKKLFGAIVDIGVSQEISNDVLQEHAVRSLLILIMTDSIYFKNAILALWSLANLKALYTLNDDFIVHAIDVIEESQNNIRKIVGEDPVLGKKTLESLFFLKNHTKDSELKSKIDGLIDSLFLDKLQKAIAITNNLDVALAALNSYFSKDSVVGKMTNAQEIVTGNSTLIGKDGVVAAKLKAYNAIKLIKSKLKKYSLNDFYDGQLENFKILSDFIVEFSAITTELDKDIKRAQPGGEKGPQHFVKTYLPNFLEAVTKELDTLKLYVQSIKAHENSRSMEYRQSAASSMAPSTSVGYGGWSHRNSFHSKDILSVAGRKDIRGQVPSSRSDSHPSV